MSKHVAPGSKSQGSIPRHRGRRKLGFFRCLLLLCRLFPRRLRSVHRWFSDQHIYERQLANQLCPSPYYYFERFLVSTLPTTLAYSNPIYPTREYSILKSLPATCLFPDKRY